VPLEAVLETNERVLFVETSKEESRFDIYSLGILEDVDRIQSFVPSDSVDKGIPRHAQPHRLSQLKWHLKQTATQACRLYNGHSCDALALMAESKVAALLEEYLHDSLKPKIIARIHDSPDADRENRRQLVEAAVLAHRATRETQAIERLANYVPGEDQISGSREVIAALNFFFVRKVLLSEGVTEKGFVCRAHHYLSLEEGACPFDSSRLLGVEDIVDEILEVAWLHGVEVILIEQRRDLMSKYDRIAAVKYRGLNPSEIWS
jgi:peptide subunit release factor 1 (eRF1)